jgi:hypothetical protein
LAKGTLKIAEKCGVATAIFQCGQCKSEGIAWKCNGKSNPFAPLSSVNVVEETFCIAGPDFLRRERRVPALALKIKSVTV